MFTIPYVSKHRPSSFYQTTQLPEIERLNIFPRFGDRGVLFEKVRTSWRWIFYILFLPKIILLLNCVEICVIFIDQFSFDRVGQHSL